MCDCMAEVMHYECVNRPKGIDYCHTNEIVQSRFSDGFLNCPVYT